MVSLMICDDCGATTPVPLPYQTEDTTAVEATGVMTDAYAEVKKYHSDKGWYTSVGYDLCPDCFAKHPELKQSTKRTKPPHIYVLHRK